MRCNRANDDEPATRTDSLAFEELIENRDGEVHLDKEGRIIGKNSRSQDKFMHDIHVAVAKNYVENLREEIGGECVCSAMPALRSVRIRVSL